MIILKRINKLILAVIIVFITMLFKTLSAQVNFTAPELIGRVTDNSITINVESDEIIDYYYEIGFESGIYSVRIPEANYFTSKANEPFEIIIDELSSNTRYFYRLVYSTDNGNNWIERDEYSFHTQRPAGNNFVFTITSDSHQSTKTSNPVSKLYIKTLSNVDNDNPDLHFDLGDTFAMTEVAIGDTNNTREQYLVQRSSMGLISHSTPIYLVIGNHEDEEGWNLDDAGDNLADSKPIMSTNARKKYFLNPIPDEFYSGDSNNSQMEIDGDHLREDYFAFEWGDALFIGIDPYWNTLTKPYSGTAGGEEDDEVVGDRWDWTLGEEQYLWFKQTLESSSATWKFVFSHQLVGGTFDYGRGGAEATDDYEWGANQNEFGLHRPDWLNDISIHQLMVDNNVSIFFHGHDHVFAKEEIDNMIYQECPQPSDISYGVGFDNYDSSETTVVINNSGHIRVSVSPSELTVDYIRAYLPAAGTNGTLAYSYKLARATSIDHSQVLDNFVLFQNYPNPFNPATTIKYSLPENDYITLRIFDLLGKRVATLVDEHQQSGHYSVKLDGSDLSTGVYIYTLSSSIKMISKKMIFIK